MDRFGRYGFSVPALTLQPSAIRLSANLFASHSVEKVFVVLT